MAKDLWKEANRMTKFKKQLAEAERKRDMADREVQRIGRIVWSAKNKMDQESAKYFMIRQACEKILRTMGHKEQDIQFIQPRNAKYLMEFEKVEAQLKAMQNSAKELLKALDQLAAREKYYRDINSKFFKLTERLLIEGSLHLQRQGLISQDMPIIPPGMKR